MVALSPRDVEISVVVASIESERSIRRCLESVFASASGHAAEVIVVDASRDATAELVRREFPQASLACMPPGTLTPLLWSNGFARSSGRAIAFTTGHCAVPEQWLSDLQSALELGAAGAGGPLSLATGTSLLDAAVYYLRYSSVMYTRRDDSHRVSQIAGDNSMYSGDAMRRHQRSFENGFWEIDFHRRLEKDGEHLVMVPSARVSFGPSFPLGVISRHRFSHGMHSGRWRALETGVNPWRIVAAAPLVPFILLMRIVRRVQDANRKLALVAACSPLLLWLGACWACGEAAGAAEVIGARRN